MEGILKFEKIENLELMIRILQEEKDKNSVDSIISGADQQPI